MSQQNADVIRDHYTAVNERDFERAMSHYAEDVELVAPAGYPVAGTHRGRDAVGAWFGDWFSTFDHGTRFEFTDISEVEGGAVLLEADLHARGRASGVKVDGHVIWLYRLREGKITRVEGFESRAEAIEAAAPRE
jgi:ketosteroid isomerase-like protein